MTTPTPDRPTRILLIEDSATYAFLLQVALESVLAPQFVLTHVERLSDGLRRLSEGQFDVVLVDLGLPDSQGLDTVIRLCDHVPTVPIVALTALTDETVAVRAVQIGVQDYVVKGPGQVDANALARTIRYAVERKRVEEALRESETRYRTLIENSHDLIQSTTPDGQLVFVNQAWLRALDYFERDLPDLLIWNLITPEEQTHWQTTFTRALAGEEINHFQTTFVSRAGRHVAVEGNVTARRVNGRVLTIQSFFRDITERKQAEATRAKLEEQLRQSQRIESIGRLAGGVAHDFNNLITVIQMYSDILRKEMSADDPRLSKVKQIRLASERAAALTRQLLAFSRKQLLAPVVLNLNELIENLYLMLERLIGEDIELSTALQPELWPTVADAGQIEQVIMNLVINARDAMPTGGMLTIETRNVYLDESYASAHFDTPLGRCVMLAVTDTGHGMDEETRAQIFEPFFTTKAPGIGTGLGLSTAHGIIKQSGGSILVYSEPGVGTTFKIYLPAGDAVQESAGTHKTQPLIRRGSETILLVEDEEMLRDLVRAVLQEKGYTILEAQTIGQAAAFCKEYEGSIDLLLTDVIMPQMSGRELAEQLKTFRPQMKVLFMSGYTDDTVVRHGVLAAEVAFLPKPFSAGTLESKVREVLDK